jgi:RNA polymerase sigma factor (TIGR02999 family)
MFGSDVWNRATNRAYLFAAAARTIRRVLADHARRRNAQKRSGGWRRLPIDHLLGCYADENLDLIELHEALERLEELNDRAAQVVTLRFFGGLTVWEVADHLGISVATAESDFRFARAWIRRAWGGGP